MWAIRPIHVLLLVLWRHIFQLFRKSLFHNNSPILLFTNVEKMLPNFQLFYRNVFFNACIYTVTEEQHLNFLNSFFVGVAKYLSSMHIKEINKVRFCKKTETKHKSKPNELAKIWFFGLAWNIAFCNSVAFIVKIFETKQTSFGSLQLSMAKMEFVTRRN